jgi:predicted small lipoprotein YifL
MKKTITIVIVLLFTLFSLAGCTMVNPGSYSKDASIVEETQKRVQDSVPIPQIQTSAERKNIASRAMLFDNENKITYIYLVSYGKVMAFYPVKGKVSSLNSYISPTDKIVDGAGRPCYNKEYNSTGTICYTVSAPDIDGAYGQNAEGIFFFTADSGAYVEWNGDYLVSDQPLRLATPVELIREVK